MALTQSVWTKTASEGFSKWECTVLHTNSENDAYTVKTPLELDGGRPWHIAMSASATADGAALPLDMWVGFNDSFALSGNDAAVTAGVCTFDVAFCSGVNPIRNGIVGVYDETNNLWCTMVETKDLKRLENSYLSGTTSNPVAYVFQETIYVKPTSVALIDIWYLTEPTDYVAGAITAECELNPALHELVLDFAEAQLWRMDAKSDLSQSSYNNALNLVKVLLQ